MGASLSPQRGEVTEVSSNGLDDQTFRGITHLSRSPQQRVLVGGPWPVFVRDESVLGLDDIHRGFGA